MFTPYSTFEVLVMCRRGLGLSFDLGLGLCSGRLEVIVALLGLGGLRRGHAELPRFGRWGRGY